MGIEAYAFAGCVVLALVLIGIAGTWRGVLNMQTRVLTAIAIVAYLYSLGPFDVFHGILYGILPMVDKARSANLVFVVSSFALAALAATGIDVLRNHRDSVVLWLRRCERRLLLLAAVVAGFVFLGLAVKLPFNVDLNGLMMVAIIAACAAGLFDGIVPIICPPASLAS